MKYGCGTWSDIVIVIKTKKYKVEFFFKRVALFSPVGGYFHVSGHLLRQQLLVVVTLLPHLLPQVDLLAIHFIYSFLYTKTKTQWRDTLFILKS